MQSFEFGVYPGGMSGTETGMTSGPVDHPQLINGALDQLQSSAQTLIVRAYRGFKGAGNVSSETPLLPEQYLFRRQLDLVLCFQSPTYNTSDWQSFITSAIERFSHHLRYLQITEEANVNLPSLDGHFPDSKRALVEGVVWAKKEVARLGLDTYIGFNATPDFNPDKQFWKEIHELASQEFYQSLDYVGLDFFPDVFRPLPTGKDGSDLNGVLRMILTMFRDDIKSAGINRNISLHITENGWPTSQSRTEIQQAEFLSSIVRAVFELRNEFNIKTYELFSLRDANSNIDDIFYQFGILRDDYSRKPAFSVFQKLIKDCCTST